MNFENVVVVVTGASKGIGRTLANILAKYKATVIGVYNSTKIKNMPFETYKCDVGNEKEVEKYIPKSGPNKGKEVYRNKKDAYDKEVFNPETGEEIITPWLEGTKIGNYLKSVHYADEAIGELITMLEEEGLFSPLYK